MAKIQKDTRQKAGSGKKQGTNSFADTVISVFTANPFQGYTFKQVAHQLGIRDTPGRQFVKKILADLERSRVIVEQNRGKYFLNRDAVGISLPSTIVEGKVDMMRTGKAYVSTEKGSEDIYIAPNNTHHAIDGDTVKVQLFPKRKGHKPEGQIIEVVKRGRKEFVGVIEKSARFAFLVPDNPSINVDIYISLDNLGGAKSGDKAIARITEWPDHSNIPFGEVVQVLGLPGDHNVEMDSILVEFGFPVSFPVSVEKEASLIPDRIPDAEAKKRRDFRNVFTITIDPEDARDFDDAISLRVLDGGRYEVGVHIADVSHYVRPGSELDQEGYSRGTSVYLVDRVIPMLPEKLSNEVCSLRPNEDKLCFSAVFEMNSQAEITGEWFGKTIICSDRRFNYDEVQQIIEKGEGDFAENVLLLHKLAVKLREERFRKGSINFTSTEVKFRLDAAGKPISTYIKEQKDSNRLIEDFMLLANRRVAELIGKKKAGQDPRTFVYRIHDEPNPEKLGTFVTFLKKLGYRLNTGTRKGLANSLNSLFVEIAGKGEENLIEAIAIRTMAKAVYSTENIGHYGLGFSHYTHFTSPIRRYPDLMVHRLLEAYLLGQPSVNAKAMEEKCEYSSEMERKAAEAERQSVKYKQAEFLLDKIGQEFNGLISGVSKYGIYVELVDSKCEGMVPLRNMKDDFYFLDEDNYQVTGQRFRIAYRLGDPVRVKVSKVDLASKQMEFGLITD